MTAEQTSAKICEGVGKPRHDEGKQVQIYAVGRVSQSYDGNKAGNYIRTGGECHAGLIDRHLALGKYGHRKQYGQYQKQRGGIGRHKIRQGFYGLRQHRYDYRHNIKAERDDEIAPHTHAAQHFVYAYDCAKSEHYGECQSVGKITHNR